MPNINVDEVNKWLSKINYEPNILEYYDNVTYNIRFYMINHTYQTKLSIDRTKGIIPNNYRLPDSSKIIIAETGVSANYDITSLILKTVHSSVSNNSSATTYQLDMKIKEINGCSLINKITAVSKLVGYENYVLQPVVMSKTTHLHPVTIMIGLLIFAHYFGIVGMIVATPCIALLKVIFKFIVKKYNLFKDDEVLLKEVLKDD